ncbi:hypothetical protein GCM10025783_02850 [Amnibacterium soli]|uniref:Host cell surface-exposed lipoprotein Ltp-like HTH region domain-containing protein n=1 Tax=Amnibacterium soli TaxID=1282736 RepID=A0ABP8YSC6_9MICO
MSRTTPDPVFAAAARAELERRVRAARPDAGAVALSLPFRPRKTWRTEFAAIAGVLVLVAGAAAGVQALRPALTGDQAPAVVDTQTAAPRPSLVPTGTPTPPPTTSAPPTSAPPAPTTRTTTAPPTAPPPTSAPPVAPTESATTPPTPASSSGLIGATGARQRSDAELRAWGASLGNGDIWIEQLVLDTHCMAEHGFIYDAQFEYSASLAAQRAGMTDAQYAAYQVAMDGPPRSGPYDWRTAGCHGLSVHVTGQDHAN